MACGAGSGMTGGSSGESCLDGVWEGEGRL